MRSLYQSFLLDKGCVAVLILCLLWPLSAVMAEGEQPASAYGQIQLWDKALTRLESVLAESDTILPGDSLDYQATLSAIAANATEMRKNETERLDQLHTQLESLGPLPSEGQPPEDETVIRKRRQLANEIRLAEGRIKQSDLALQRAADLSATIGRKEQTEIHSLILSKGPSPVKFDTWAKAITQDLMVLANVGAATMNWLANLPNRPFLQLQLFLPLFGLLLAIFLSLSARRILLRRFGPNPAHPAPSYARRLIAGFVSTIAHIMLPALAIAAIAALASLLLNDDRAALLRPIAANIDFHVTWFMVVTGLAISAFSPQLPAWRIMPVPESASGLLAGQIVVGSAFLLGSAIFQSLLVNPATNLPGLDIRSLLALFNSLVATLIFMPALRSRFWEIDGGEVVPQLSRLLRFGAAIAILSSLVASLLGYANLSHHLLSALSITAVVVGIVFILRELVSEGLRTLFAPEGRYYPRLAKATGITAESGRRIIFWLQLLSELAIWLPALYVLLIAYGLSQTLLNSWVAGLSRGIAIGNLHIAPLDFGTALLTIILGFLAVGGIKRWMRDRVMPNTGLDLGLQNSIATGVGYLGGLIVLMMGIAVLGMDLSSLALVAGALSVGMGFGLKTIVENFVAGIILLIERPVKAGDWIVVGSAEGIVKSISVRATEIETFDRASVILPNSELIASPVTNWTHKNKIARIVVKISIVANQDPKRAQELLLQCAVNHPRVMRHPAPSVVLRSIAATVNLELRCFISDSDYYLPTLSDLNFAAHATFQREGIKFPE